MESNSNQTCIIILWLEHKFAIIMNNKFVSIHSGSHRSSIRCVCSDVGDGTFRLLVSIPCLIMHWLLKSLVHQQGCYWLYRANNSCRLLHNHFHVCRANQIKDTIQNVNMSYIILKPFSVLRVNNGFIFIDKYITWALNHKTPLGDGFIIMIMSYPKCQYFNIIPHIETESFCSGRNLCVWT